MNSDSFCIALLALLKRGTRVICLLKRVKDLFAFFVKKRIIIKNFLVQTFKGGKYEEAFFNLIAAQSTTTYPVNNQSICNPFFFNLNRSPSSFYRYCWPS